MHLEIKYSTAVKFPENFFEAMKTSLNKKFYIFQRISIPEINMSLFENFQDLIALQVWSHGFTKILQWFAHGTALGLNNLNSLGAEI